MRRLTVLLVLMAMGCSYDLNDCKTDQDCRKVRADLVCDTAHDLCVQKACMTDSDCASVGSNIVCDQKSKRCVVSENPTCQNGCSAAGDRRCDPNGAGVETCAQQSNGCLEWSAPVACPSGQTCSNGQCSGGCANACSTAGQPQCSPDGSGVETCAQQSDGCLGWSAPVACPSGHTCSNGQCSGGCTNACSTEGQAQCSPDGSGVETCAQQSDGCLGWSAAHSCGGSVCQQGLCRPIALAGSVDRPVSIAVNSSGVYWVSHDSGGALETPDASGVARVLATFASGPIALALDQNNAYWLVGAGEIVKAPLAVAGTTASAVVGSIGGSPSSIAVDANHIFWVNAAPTGTGNGNAVEVSDLNGGSVAALWSPTTYPCLGVTLAGGNAFFTTTNPDRVSEVSPDPSSPTNLVVDTVQPRAITSDGTDLFWTSDSGAIYEEPVSGRSNTPTETKIVSDAGAPVAIAADGASVVWVDRNAGTVSEYDRAASTTTTLATGQAGPNSVALDSSFVYWSNGGSSNGTGSIMKLAR